MTKVPIDLFRRNIHPEIIGLVPNAVARKNRVIPICRDKDGFLLVAVTEPYNETELVEKLRRIVKMPVRVVRTTYRAIEFAIRRYYPTSDHRLA